MKTTIFLVICFILFVPCTSYPWFSIQEDGPGSHFQITDLRQELISSKYILPANNPSKTESPSLVKGDRNQFYTSADIIDIDIPLNTLIKQAVDPVSSLDRQITANLRIRNILEEYLAAKNKTQQILKDLSIPYMDSEKKGNIQRKKDDIHTIKILEKEIENISFYSIGYLTTDLNQRPTTDPVVQVEKRFQKNGDRTLDPERTVSTGFNEFGGVRNPTGPQAGNSHISELPWIFRFIFKTVQFVYSNKLEILLWIGMFSVMVTLIALVIRK